MSLALPCIIRRIQQGIVLYEDNVPIPLWGITIDSVETTGQNLDIIKAVDIDSNNNIYIAGTIGSNGATTIDLCGMTISRPSGKNQGILIAKYDNNGIPQWGKIIDSSGAYGIDEVTDIKVDVCGNIILSGNIGYNDIQIDMCGLTLYRAVGRAIGGLIAKYDTYGNPLWGRTIDSNLSEAYNDWANSVTSDNSNNIYAAISFVGVQIDIGGGQFFNREYNLLVGAGVVKYDPSGTPLWAISIDTSGSDAISGIVSDNNNNIYIIGSCGENGEKFLDLCGLILERPASSSYGMYIAKYNYNGKIQWGQIIDTDIGSSHDMGQAISVDNNGNVYIVGKIGNASGSLSTIINLGGGVTITRPPNRSSGILVAKYDTNGIPKWGKIIDTSGTDNDTVTSCNTDNKGNVYVTGFIGNLGGTAIDLCGMIITRPANRGEGALIAKYDTNGIPKWGKIIDTVNQNYSDGSFDITADNKGNIYLVGGCYGGGSQIDLCGMIISRQSRRAAGGLLARYNDLIGIDLFDSYYDITTLQMQLKWLLRGYKSITTPLQYKLTDLSTNSIVTSGTDILYNTLIYPEIRDISYNYKVEITNAKTAQNQDISNTTSIIVPKLNVFDTYNSPPLWGISMSGDSGIDSYEITTDISQNIYMIGVIYSPTSGTYTINLGGLTVTRQAQMGRGIIIIKYNSMGIPQWYRIIDTVGGSDNDYGYGIVTDASANVYITGTVTSTGTQIDLGDGRIVQKTASANSAVLLAKYNSNGNSQWGLLIDSSGADGSASYSSSALAYSNNNIYMSACIGGTIGNIINISGFLFNKKANVPCYIAVKFNTNGIPQWITQISSKSSTFFIKLATDVNNNIYVATRLSPTDVSSEISGVNVSRIVYRNLSYGIATLITKINPSGDPVWAKIIDSSGDDNFTSITSDISNNVYITGEFGSGATQIDLCGLIVSKQNSTGRCALIAKYDANGIPQWGKIIHTTQTNNDTTGYYIKSDLCGNIYVSGQVSTGASNLKIVTIDTTSIQFTINNSIFYFATMLSPDGNLLWFKPILSTGATNNLSVNCLSLDNSANIIVTGQILNTTSVDICGMILTTVSSNRLPFIAKYKTCMYHTIDISCTTTSTDIIFTWTTIGLGSNYNTNAYKYNIYTYNQYLNNYTYQSTTPNQFTSFSKNTLVSGQIITIKVELANGLRDGQYISNTCSYTVQ